MMVLQYMNDDGVVEISLPLEGELTWWKCEVVEFKFPDGRIEKDREHFLLKPTEVVMR